jgi:diguanylate cyclase (GGDEF)-like protein
LQSFVGTKDNFSLFSPIQVNEKRLGVWAVAIDQSIDEPDAACLKKFVLVSSALALVIPNLLRLERLKLKNDQVEKMSELLGRSSVPTDPESLFENVLYVLTHQFCFDRVIIGLINDETQSLRPELYIGFNLDSLPAVVNMEEKDNLFIRHLDEDIYSICESRNDMSPELVEYFDGSGSERGIFLPLNSRRGSMGYIYADQAEYNGSPLDEDLFRSLIRQVSSAFENLKLRNEAEWKAETDPLTGLRNRHYMDKVLEFEIPRVKWYQHPISLLMIDLCGFKHINDTDGHQFGDFILKETAHLLQASVRKPDIVIRYGGDEFVVLMVNTTEEQASQVRGRIERAFIERNRCQSDH